MAFSLPRLQSVFAIVTETRFPTSAFQQWWQSVVEKIEQQEEVQNQTIADLQATQAELAATQADLTSTQADLTAAVADLGVAQGDIATLEATAVLKDQGPAWTDATGTAARTALASYAGQVVSNPPTQAQMQALDDAVKAISQHLVAVINDGKANGVLT